MSRNENYSGYYGDANSREHLGTNRFGSDRIPHYNNNRYLDHDDSFINQEVSGGWTRNIGTNQSWEPREMANSSDVTPYMEKRSRDQMNRSVNFYGKGPKGWKRSDERIKEDVSEALYRNYHVDASYIEVDVNAGEVALKGSVDSRMSKKEAERCVENISGVVDVRNELIIQNQLFL